MGKYLLGFDVGTMGSKGVLVDLAGRVVTQHTVPHELSIPKPGWAEHDADGVWWHDAQEICRALVAKSGIDPVEIAAVGCSAIGPTMLPVDGEGKPLRSSILYGIDTRATEEIEILNREIGSERIFSTTGQKLTTQSVGPKILWFKRHEPALYARTARILSATSYLVFRLTGKYVVDYYTAPSFSPLFDLERLQWDEAMCTHVCPVEMLPEAHWATDVAGRITREAARETGLAEGTPVIAGTIDATAEAISVGAVNPGEAMLMYGTTMFMISVLDSFRAHPALWALAYTMPGRAVVAAGQATSAALTKWFRDNFGHVEKETERLLSIDAYQLLMAEAESVPAGSGGLIALPYFSGERTPIYDPLARGMVIGLTLSHTRAHVYRALLEGTAFGLRHTFETMAEIGALPDKLIAVGGGTKNSLWLQIVSDVTSIPQEVPKTTIGASYGDAFLAGIGAGLFSDFNEIRTRWIEPGRTVAPNPAAHKLYSEYYQVFRALYENNKDSMHRLAELGSR